MSDNIFKDTPCQEASIHSHETFIPCGRPGYSAVFHSKDRRVYVMCDQCTYHNVKNRGGIQLRPTVQEGDQEFIFTRTLTGRRLQEMHAMRTPPPHEVMDRWVKCHIIGKDVVIGDIV